jgi:ribosomal protein L32
MPGARKEGQSAIDRIDVARCAHCAKHHDRNHVCPKCGLVPQAISEDAVQRALRGESVKLNPNEHHEVRRRMAAAAHQEVS